MNNLFSPFNRYRYNPNYYARKNMMDTTVLQKTVSLKTNSKNISAQNQIQGNGITTESILNESTNYNNIEKTENILNKNPSKSPNDNKNSVSTPLIEFHGIELYSDDLLILLVIFFLYKENIDDKLLLISLISLLF